MKSLGQLIHDTLMKWAYLGVKVSPSGSKAIGRPRPEDGVGFLHEIYAPISEAVLQKEQRFNPLFRNFSYPSMLTEVNGLKAFNRSFCLYGFHHGQQSSVDLPFNIVSENQGAWGVISGTEQLVIGSGEFGYRTIAYVQRSNGFLYAAEGMSEDSAGEILYVWPSLEKFVESELGRLNAAHNVEGVANCDLETLLYSGGTPV